MEMSSLRNQSYASHSKSASSHSTPRQFPAGHTRTKASPHGTDTVSEYQDSQASAAPPPATKHTQPDIHRTQTFSLGTAHPQSSHSTPTPLAPGSDPRTSHLKPHPQSHTHPILSILNHTLTHFSSTTEILTTPTSLSTLATLAHNIAHHSSEAPSHCRAISYRNASTLHRIACFSVLPPNVREWGSSGSGQSGVGLPRFPRVAPTITTSFLTTMTQGSLTSHRAAHPVTAHP